MENDGALWFYADSGNQPVGPMPWAKIQDLAAQGIITSSTLVIAEGGSEWLTYASVAGISTGTPPPPPPARGSTTAVVTPSTLFWVLLGASLFCCAPIGIVIALVSKKLTSTQKGIFVAVGCVWLLLQAIFYAVTPHTASASYSQNTVVETPSAVVPTPAPTPDVPRFAIEKGAGGFLDRQSVEELAELKKRNAPDSDYVPIREKQQAAGKRLDFTQNYIVREDTSEPPVADYRKVVSETPLPGGIKSFWVHKSILNGVDSFTGSKLLLGYYIFRGGDGLFVNNQVPIRDLGDVVDALYEGKLSAKAAKNCVFTPSAQQADFKKQTGDYSLYAVRTASWSPERYFAMPRHGKQLGHVSVRYSGNEEFTGGDGAVFSIPVFVPEPAVKE